MATEHPDMARFMSRVHKTDDCWIFRNYRGGEYGTFTLGGMSMNAHRASYFLHVGPVHDDLVVRHDCDNRPCVNPAHLRTGTSSQNMVDSWKRRRPDGQRGPIAEAQDAQMRAAWLAIPPDVPLSRREAVFLEGVRRGFELTGAVPQRAYRQDPDVLRAAGLRASVRRRPTGPRPKRPKERRPRPAIIRPITPLGDVRDTTGRRLDVALARRVISRADLARAVRAEPAAFSRFANYGVPCPGVTWAAIAAELHVPVEALKVGGPWEPLVDPGR